ncbi:MAG: GNAT family N-acetyltransferase [Maricaulaceae bacterium]
MIGPITPDHHAQFLRMNERFVHWLAPLTQDDLTKLLRIAQYAHQIGGGDGALLGYAHDVDYPDHWNLEWLRGHMDNFFYIDRVIIAKAAHGKGYGRALYDDVANFARAAGHTALACEVNTVPDNPSSHHFHLSMGFQAIGEQTFKDGVKAVRYYMKNLT